MVATSLGPTSSPVLERYSYTPYGQRTVCNADFSIKTIGTTLDNAVGHQGLSQDRSTGLFYNRARYNDPGTL